MSQYPFPDTGLVRLSRSGTPRSNPGEQVDLVGRCEIGSHSRSR